MTKDVDIIVDNPEDGVVAISQAEYDEYQKLGVELEKEKNNGKTWQEKYMEQVAKNKELQETNKGTKSKELEEMKEKNEQIIKEAQEIYADSQRLERGMIKFIKM